MLVAVLVFGIVWDRIKSMLSKKDFAMECNFRSIFVKIVVCLNLDFLLLSFPRSLISFIILWRLNQSLSLS